MARKVKSQAKAKQQKEEAMKLIAHVPEEYVFRCNNGDVYSDMEELAEGLRSMTDEVFAYHANDTKNDFVNWVRDIIRDEELAINLAEATSREQADECICDRVAVLTRLCR
ncbi:MAG: hypothetical protein HY662_01270 [Chloroflexi bacterium]|nr:hypothetical protein [Chloroflexota bacterium]